MKIENYFVHYFRQDEFVFIIVTLEANVTFGLTKKENRKGS